MSETDPVKFILQELEDITKGCDIIVQREVSETLSDFSITYGSGYV